MSAVHKTRRHRGVVPCFIDDIFPHGWADWMDIPSWPDVVVQDAIFGLTAIRWAQLADRARTIQERTVTQQLGEHSTIAEIAVTTGLSPKRVEQIARGLFDRVAKPPAAAHQMDMFEDGGDK